MARKSKIGEEESQEIISLLKEGKTLGFIAVKMGLGKRTISEFKKRNNLISFNSNKKIDDENRLKICELYSSGISAPKLAKQFNCSNPTIFSVLEKNGIKRRDKYERRKQYKVNQNYFGRIDCHEKAQILGMYAADGHVHKTRLHIGLTEGDKSYLEWMKEKMEFTGPIHFKKAQTPDKNVPFGNQKDSYFFDIFSQKMLYDLSILGIVPVKSLILSFPKNNQIPEEFIKSYILGYFEGDGSIAETKRGDWDIKICCTLEFGETLIKLVKEKLNINSRMYKPKDNKIHYFCISGNYQILKFLDWIYQDSIFQMSRKHDKYLKLKERYKTKYA